MPTHTLSGIHRATIDRQLHTLAVCQSLRIGVNATPIVYRHFGGGGLSPLTSALYIRTCHTVELVLESGVPTIVNAFEGGGGVHLW